MIAVNTLAFSFHIFLLISTVTHAARQKRPSKSPSVLQEYREVLPRDIFAQFSSIYLDKSIGTTEKLRLLDDLFKALPDGMLKKLPLPSAFRRLPSMEQRKVHRIYYGKAMAFRDKLRKLEQFLRELPGNERELVPIRPMEERRRLGSAERRGQLPMPNLVEFDVPVLLQFNGHMETNSLKQYLPREEFQLLRWIVHRHGIDEMSRARLIGVMLKKAYQMRPDNFPLPLNGDSQEIADEIRHLGVRLMFGRNPFDRVDPFGQKFEMLKRIRANQRKCSGNAGDDDEGSQQPCQDEPGEQSSKGLLESVDFFPGTDSAEEWRHQQQQQDEGEMLAREEAEARPRLSGDMLGKFIALFNGTIHWKL